MKCRYIYIGCTFSFFEEKLNFYNLGKRYMGGVCVCACIRLNGKGIGQKQAHGWATNTNCLVLHVLIAASSEDSFLMTQAG